MKNIIYISVLLLFVVSCRTTKETTQENVKVVTKNDTVYIETFKDLPNTQALVSKYNIASNYYPAKGYNHRVKYIILHYTAMDNEGSARVLTQKGVSSHYLVQTYYDKDIQLLVPESERAWHAGVSYWRGKENLNDTSIGIEIVNEGYTGDRDNMMFYEFPSHQIDKVAALTMDIIRRYDIQPENVIGHSDVAPDRKQDPGPKFPWKELYDKYRIGAWYNDYDKSYYMTHYPSDDAYLNSYGFIQQVQSDFHKYGYRIAITGQWDDQTEKVIQAFQFHFRPSNYSGKMDRETWAILQALLRKYPPK